MNSNISQQIESIQKALDWIKANEPQDYERQFLSFVEERRKLYKVAEAELFNPAAAAYGESQKGKSYLMSNLLQDEGKPFMISYDGHEYNFITEMNPKGDGAEATGVVTRFTSFRRGGELYSQEHPLLMRTLSMVDVVIVLADGYYNDIRDYSVADNIKEKVEAFYQKYVNAPVVKGSPIKPDDLLDMEFYFNKYINNAQAYGKDNYFKRLALVADRIPVADFEKVFGLLWDDNEHFTALFRRLLDVLKRIDYAPFVYLPVDAVLLNDDDNNTIMAVQCLHGMTPESTARTKVFLREGSGYREVDNIRKCDLAAICAEVIVKIPDNFLNSSASYCTDGITDSAVLSRISKTPIKKDILAKVDLLDFPGARSRKKEEKSTLNKGNLLTTILLRGKVAYLFNKYNENRAINLLLFCHDHRQSNVPELPILVANWVNNYVGRTPEKRLDTVRNCGGISPLFYIATMFNMDMALQAIDAKNSSDSIKGRWAQRFTKVVFPDCFNGVAQEWVTNWTHDGEKFANSYLLRDFKYSGDNGSRLYRGFSSTGRETEMTLTSEYYETLRSTFIQSTHTAQFFNEPQLAWDMAATINNDGALFIIEKLGIVSDRVSSARNQQFAEIYDKAKTVVSDAMKHYQPADGAAEQMVRNRNNAYAVMRELDFACNDDNYYFGHLIQGLQLKIRDIHDVIHQLIVSGALSKPVNDFSKYQIIRERCGNFANCKTQEEKWACLIKAYNYGTKDAAAADLKRKGIDIATLLADKLMPQLPSYIISDTVLTFWKEKIKSVDFNNTYASDTGFSPSVLTELVNNLVDTVERLELVECLHADLAPYADIAAVKNIPISLVSDIIVSSISNFVTDFGFSMLDAEKKNELKQLAQAEDWPVFKYISQPRQELYEDEEIANLFDDVLTSGTPLTPAFKHNFFSWEEYVFLSFMLRVERPKYSIDVCKQLDDLVKEINETESYK